jgi:hypothetical protein
MGKRRTDPHQEATMSRPAARAARRPLALAALAALAACADDPSSTAPTAPRAAVAVDPFTVTNTSGGTDVGSLRWAAGNAANAEVVRFAPELAGQTIVLDTTLVIRRSVVIEGPRDGGITISGGGRVRVIDAFIQTAYLTLRNVSVTGGYVPYPDGRAGIAAYNLTLEHSTVWGNRAHVWPAIGANYLSLKNSTVSGNVSTGGFPAIHAFDYIGIASSTVTGNQGGGIYATKQLDLVNSIVAANPGGPNCGNTAGGRYGFSLSDDASCGTAAVLIGAPQLADLADNGGPAPTHAIAASSPARDAAENCTYEVDQRYVPRGLKCDIGAFEIAEAAPIALAITETAALTVATGRAVLSGTATCPLDRALTLKVRLDQPQKGGAVSATAQIPVTCTPTGTRWSATMAPAAGRFARGSAHAAAESAQADPTPPASASATVKLVARK